MRLSTLKLSDGDGITKNPKTRRVTTARKGHAVHNVTKDMAQAEMQLIMANKTSALDLISHDHYTRVQKAFRSALYKSNQVLCHSNSITTAGWIVCTYALNGCCLLSKAIRKFDQSVGTSTLSEHSSSHDSDSALNTFKEFVAVGRADKKMVADAAAMAAGLGHLPMSFTINRPGMLLFVEALLLVGQSVPVGKKIDVSHLVPCTTTITSEIERRAREVRQSFATHHVADMIRMGGGVTSDGLKERVNGRKLYNFVVHYFEISKANALSGNVNIKYRSRVLFLEEHEGPESAAALRTSFNAWLIRDYGVSLDEVLETYNFVTDCASTMPCIAGASSSSSKVAFCETWVGCITHQLNTAMKKTMKKEEDDATFVAADLGHVKVLVRVFKHGSWNAEMPAGKALLQESETRFGTTFAVVQRFLKANGDVQRIVSQKNSHAATVALSKLVTNSTVTNEDRYPCLVALKEAFEPVVHMQTKLEASKSPCMHIVLPMLLHLKDQLKQKSNGLMNNRTMSVPNVHTQRLCGFVLMALSDIEIHDIWISASILHPGLKHLRFVMDITERDAFKQRGAVMIRKLMKKVHGVDTQDNNVSEVRVVSTELGAEKFDIGNAMYFASNGHQVHDDELHAYLSHVHPPSLRNDIDDEMGVVRFWHRQSGKYPVLSRVAFRVLATPPSSAASERDFSSVARILTPARNCTGCELVADIIQLRADFQNE